ncbi:helix-turn-helix domain-containing protein [Stenotrophomonas sp. Iso1]|uniref:helix-turn-helix domain-containing protein n=1 Tax=Stenotrophomonas sp. Iso1 TaxID=2977283 RepID=UPI0022B7BE2A|nr:helix-turn-helix domain-containing protein [Stenotrophomonas sp. Iso1]
MQELDIGQVSRQSGLPASTLRYYEERGLICPVGRNGLRRVYDADVMQRLALIALGRATGFSLDEIAGMFDEQGRFAVDRPQLLRKANDLDRHIQRLQALRDGLRHAARCKQTDHLQCPVFRRLLNNALLKHGKHRPQKMPAPR